MNPLQIIGIVQAGLSMAPTIVQSIEVLFGHKPKPATPAAATAQSLAKRQAALNMAVAGISAALEIDPTAFGDPEKALITSIHNDVVTYFNVKGWQVG